MNALSDKEVAQLFGLKPEETTPKLEDKKPAPQEVTELPLPPPPPDMKPKVEPINLENDKYVAEAKQAPKVYGVKEATGWIVASTLAGVLLAVVGLIVIGII